MHIEDHQHGGNQMLFKKKIQRKTYDPAVKRPVIRASICTGEQVAGFQNIRTGHFEEVLLIRTPGDLKDFKEMYGIVEDPEIIY